MEDKKKKKKKQKQYKTFGVVPKNEPEMEVKTHKAIIENRTS